MNGWDGYEHRAPRMPTPARGVGVVNPPTYVSACACGGEVVVTRMDDDNLAAAVWAHASTLGHQAWRNRQVDPDLDVRVERGE